MRDSFSLLADPSMKYLANHLLKLLQDVTSFEKVPGARNTVCQRTRCLFRRCIFLSSVQLWILCMSLTINTRYNIYKNMLFGIMIYMHSFSTH